MLRRIFIVKFIMLLLIAALPVNAQLSEADRANKIKAAFALNLARFVVWPDDRATADQITMCLFEDNFLGLAKNSVVGQKIGGLPLAVIEKINSETVKSCQIIFIAGERFEDFRISYPKIVRQPILIIVDNTVVNETAIESSLAMVSLIRKGGSIGFDINLEQVEAAQLIMSSKLLKLARHVHRGDQ